MARIEFADPDYPTDQDDLDELLRTYRPVTPESMGIHSEITDVETVSVRITGKEGSHVITLLRYFTAGDGPISEDDQTLTQLLTTEAVPFETAIVAAIGEDLADAEERIALSAYRHAMCEADHG